MTEEPPFTRPQRKELQAQLYAAKQVITLQARALVTAEDFARRLVEQVQAGAGCCETERGSGLKQIAERIAELRRQLYA